MVVAKAYLTRLSLRNVLYKESHMAYGRVYIYSWSDAHSVSRKATKVIEYLWIGSLSIF